MAERRKMTKEQVLTIADGSIYTGSEALAIGLVDQIGGEDEAMQWFSSQNVKTQKISTLHTREHKSVFKTINSLISQLVYSYISK